MPGQARRYRGGNAQYFKGQIKSVALYSDIRTADEIAAELCISRSYVSRIEKAALDKLDTQEFGFVLRAKGIVAGKDGKWIHFDYVPGEPDVRVGSAGIIGRLCVIGADLDREALSALFGAELK